ncbi:DUF7424 family protein [Providencia sp. PROV202]|uniref:DUF7424 family protein n=1 Tax=Providencia sp. PROV202 TaxID=2949902 RepID=UPI002348F572|nr:hypothetical protein [Providencia sp. PROV202]
MKKSIGVLAAIVLLSGCKVDVETKVNTDDLLSTEHKLVQGSINVEVPSCNDFEDSRKESKSLIEIKQKLPTVFKNIEFKECYKQKFNSYASFSVPVGVGYFDDNPKAVDAEIYVFANKITYAGIVLMGDTANKLANAKKSSPGELNLAMTLVLEKGKQPIPNIAALGVYMTGIESKNSPITLGGVKIEGKEIKLRLSDVSNSMIENGKITSVLVKAEYLEGLLTQLKP